MLRNHLGLSTFEQDANLIRPILGIKHPHQAALAAWAWAGGGYTELPGLRGYWPMNAINGSGDVVDQSGNGLVLTQTNTPRIFYAELASFTRFQSSASEKAVRTDEAAFDITGSETYITSSVQGLTLGCWVYFVSLPGTYMNMLSKWKTSTADRSYRLAVNASSQPQFQISSDGTTTFTLNGSAVVIDKWYFICGRYDATTPKLDLFVGSTDGLTMVTNSTGIGASIYSGAADFVMGSNHAGTEFLDARIAKCFLCAAMLSDDTIAGLFSKTKSMFFE